MKLSAEARNAKIHSLLADLIKEAKGRKEITHPSPFVKEEVEALFASHIWGHREITLTIILARMLDPKFKASEDFYASNPRSIYEHPIRELLRKHGIPHKKSGPLNVAKNSQRIDETWAHNKRGDGMALVVAKLVKKIEAASPAVLRKFALAYVQRYLLEAIKVAKLKHKVRSVEDPLYLYQLAHDMIVNVPDGGTTAQLIAGVLIENFNASHGNAVKTGGHTDSVSATNTTSGKPGDITEELKGSATRIYEITTKAFSIDRMIESYEAIKAWDKEGKITEALVICRKEDVPAEATKLTSNPYLIGMTKYQDIIYYFVDVFAWTQERLLFMPATGRAKFYSDLAAHVNQLNTSEKVKRYFSEWHREHPVGQ